MERSLSHQNSSTGPARLSTRTIQSGSYDMPDLQVRMSKKIAQLTNVIHQLHTKSEDHEMDLQDMSEAYEAEIEQMLKDAASKINTFKNQLEAVRDDTRFKEAVKKIEECYSKEKEESLAAIATYKQKMAEREIAIQNAVKKQMMDLEASFQGLQKKLDGAAQELAQVKRQSSEHEESLQKQIEKAREETEEAIQSGNHRYNSMLHDSMNKQDNLNRQIDALKLKIAGKAGEVRDLETQMSSLRIDAEEFKSRQLKSWEEERNAASAQRDQEERMWQDRLQESMKQVEESRLATLAANRKLGAVQAELTETREKFTAELAAEAGRSGLLSNTLSDVRNELQTMTTSRDEMEQELKKQHSICDDLKQQLADFSTKHESHLKNASEEEKKLAAQVQHLSADLQKARIAVKDTEAANTRAYQEIQKSAIALESRTSELQDAYEQIKQLQKTLVSEIEDRKSDKISADAALAEQIAAKNEELQNAAQQLAAADKRFKSLEEAGKKQSADAHAAALSEAAERLSQAQEVHSKEVERFRTQHEQSITSQAQKHQEEITELKRAKDEELEAAAQAAENTLKQHQQRASEELQATEASWSAMASDLQDQVTELQKRIRTVECECDEMQQKLDRADSISVRNMKDAQGQYEAITEELNGLQQENLELQRRLQELDAEKQHLADAVAKSQSAATQEEGALRATIDDLTKAREIEKNEAQELLDQQRLELGAHWQCKLDRAVKDALSNAESSYEESLHNRETSLKQRLEEQHEATVAELNCSHAEELKALTESLYKEQSSNLEAQEQEWKRKMLDTESRLGTQAAAELDSVRQSAEKKLKAARDAADEEWSAMEQQHAEQLAAMQQAHKEKLSEHRAQHDKAVESLEAASREAALEASQQLSNEKQRASADIKKLQDGQREAEALAKLAQGSLKRKLDETQEKLDSTTAARDKLTKDLAEVQAALAKKVLEMNDAMHEASQSRKQEIASLKGRHQRETEEAETTYCRRIAALKATLEDVTTEHDEKYENLSQAYGELKLAWDNRGARQEDLDRINNLQQMIDDRDEQIQGFSKKYNELRNEMLLREDNYNNHFANGGMGKQVLGVDRALSSGEDVAGWMLKKNSSTLQRMSSSARPSGPRASRIE